MSLERAGRCPFWRLWELISEKQNNNAQWVEVADTEVLRPAPMPDAETETNIAVPETLNLDKDDETVPEAEDTLDANPITSPAYFCAFCGAHFNTEEEEDKHLLSCTA